MDFFLYFFERKSNDGRNGLNGRGGQVDGNEETITIRSGVLAPVMRQALMRGSLLAGIGVLSLLIGGAFLPVDLMKVWGPFLFLFGVALITWGLLPYKRLKRLEENPYTLTGEGTSWLHFSARGKALFSIPIVSIDHIDYLDQGNVYGIAVLLKEPLIQKLVVDDPNFDLGDFRRRSLKTHSCDLFLSYFSKRSFLALEEHLRAC